MFTGDSETDLNGHFDVIFIPHPCEVSNLHEEEVVSQRCTNQFFNASVF